MIQGFVADERSINAVQVVQELFQDLLQSGDDLGKPLETSTTTEFLGVMGNGLEAKNVLAFGIGLQSQLAEVQLENRQVIRRCLDADF